MDLRAGLLYVGCEMVDAEPHWIELHWHREVATVTTNLMAPRLAHAGPLPRFGATGIPKLAGLEVQTGRRETWWKPYHEARAGVRGHSDCGR
jgi:hypothetical protein